MKPTQYAIIYGDIFEGFQGVVGPFATREEAEAYAESHNLGHFERAVFAIEEATK